MIVLRVTEKPVRNLKELVAAVEGNKETFLQLDLSPHDEIIVLEAAKVKEATKEVLSQHSIASDRSEDLR